MTREAWFCPACQKHHAPHVETCPGSGIGTAPVYPIPVYRYEPPRYWEPAPWPYPVTTCVARFPAVSNTFAWN